MLFVSVKLGLRPVVETFVDNAVAVRALARHAMFIITPTLGLRELHYLEDQPRPTKLRQLRTTLNHTWDNVRDAPSDGSVAGGASGGLTGVGTTYLFALHQLLRTGATGP